MSLISFKQALAFSWIFFAFFGSGINLDARQWNQEGTSLFNGDVLPGVKPPNEKLRWLPCPVAVPPTKPVLEQAIAQAGGFLLRSQTPEGCFVYQCDLYGKASTESDNPVRQAGALWGLALINQHQSTSTTRQALAMGFLYFRKYGMHGAAPAAMAPAYQGNSRVATGTVALLGLALIDYLRTEPPVAQVQRMELEAQLDGYLSHLVAMREPNGHFASTYDLLSGQIQHRPSPYYDGEALLCLAKASKYLSKKELIPLVKASGDALLQDYTGQLGARQPVQAELLQFYQWGSMAFWEIQDAGWDCAESYREAVMRMANWLIHTRRIGENNGNVGHAIEGLAYAYKVAENTGNKAAMEELQWNLITMGKRMLALQVKLQGRGNNRYRHAQGAFRSKKGDPILRIDFTQHSLHALLLILKCMQVPH